MILIDQTDFIAQSVNFVLLVALLYWLLYKPVRSFMDQRTSEIEAQIQSARENKAAAEALRIELEKQANENRQQARRFLDDASKKAEQLRLQLMGEAKQEANEIIQRAKEVTRLEKEKARAELREEVGELSLLLASKIISESLDQTRHQHLIEQTLKQLDPGESRNSQ